VVNAFASFKKGDPKTLLLGLGGGSIARELKTRVSSLDVVEIDPRIISLSTSHFYLSPKGINFINDDARHYIHQCKKKYDLVIYDVLTGETQPNYVFTKEALAELNLILSDKAIVVVNFQGIIKGKDKAFNTLYKTFNSAGFQVKYYSTQMKKSEDIVFVLSKTTLNPDEIKMENLNTCCKESDEMDEFIKHPFTSYKPDLSKTEVLTDDKPILELLNRQAMKDWRKDQNETYTKSNLKYGISVFK
jgi:spermidine synthase